MQHRLALPFVLVVLVVLLGVAPLAPAQFSRTPLPAGTSDLQAASLATIPNLNGLLQAMGATGNVIAGPASVQGTGTIAGLTLYNHGAAARDLVLTVVNTGDETIEITGNTGLLLFSVPPGHSRSATTNTAGLSSAYKWNCPGTGDYQFAWVLRAL